MYDHIHTVCSSIAYTVHALCVLYIMAYVNSTYRMVDLFESLLFPQWFRIYNSYADCMPHIINLIVDHCLDAQVPDNCDIQDSLLLLLSTSQSCNVHGKVIILIVDTVLAIHVHT